MNGLFLIDVINRYRTLKTNKIFSMPIIILMPHSRCNCRCVMCDIWKGNNNVQQLEESDIEKLFLEGTRMGATPVTHGIALPHLRLSGLMQAEMVIVRGRKGIHIKFKDPLTNFEEAEQDVHAIFFLVSPKKDPTQHLRILAQIAGRVEEETFESEWRDAKDEQEIKEALLHEDRCLSIIVSKKTAASDLINKALKDIRFPDGCLVAMLRRKGQTIIPKGSTVILEGDRLTIIGDPKSMDEIKKEFEEV